MNKNNTAVRRILPLTLASLGALGGLQPAAADILLYDKDETTFSTDGYFNAFYVNSDVDRQGETYDRRQSRVKMGFLPNYIGFNFGRKVDELSLGGRASFWVTINDSETDGTDTAIDVRQFYGTVAGDWGEVLIGKDFGLFSRSNIFLDELLANPLWLAVIGGSALLALLVLLMILSRRNAQKEKEEVQAFAADAGEEQEDALDLGKDGFDDLTLDEPEPQVAAAAPQVEKTTAQTSDALGEADIYIAYGRFNQAAELLQNAIYDEPQRTDLRLKLMEVYAEMGDREGFARQENELREIGGAQPQVEQLKSRYPAMVAVAAVAGLAGAKLAQDELDSFSLDDLSLDDSGHAAKPDAAGQDLDDAFDLSLDDLGGDDVQADLKSDSGALDDLTLDSDLDLAASTAADKPVDDLDFGLDFAELAETPSQPKHDDLGDFSLDLDAPEDKLSDDDFLLSLNDEVPAAAPADNEFTLDTEAAE
ncbi:porin, partial [Pseudomonas aeruginosa]|nr:porin [Pseudomonas aeruginosa]